VGRTVVATATVTSVDDKAISFSVTAHDGVEAIGTGTHVRAPIELDRFNKRLEEKARRR
jgi:fluoroacetyl-CoA thioesterase